MGSIGIQPKNDIGSIKNGIVPLRTTLIHWERHGSIGIQPKNDIGSIENDIGSIENGIGSLERHGFNRDSA